MIMLFVSLLAVVFYLPPAMLASVFEAVLVALYLLSSVCDVNNGNGKTYLCSGDL